MAEDDLTPFEKQLLEDAKNAQKASEHRAQTIKERDEFVGRNSKSPLADALNSVIGLWNKKEGVAGKVRDAAGLAIPGLGPIDQATDLLSAPRINPKAIAEQAYALGTPVEDSAGRAAAGRNLKGLMSAAAGAPGNAALGLGAKLGLGSLDALNGMMAEEENWAPLTTALMGSATTKLGSTAPMRKLLDLPADRSLQQATSPLEVLQQFFQSKGGASTGARMMFPLAQGAAVDLAGQAGDPNTGFHTPVAGLGFGAVGTGLNMLGQHLHNAKFSTPSYANELMAKEMEKVMGLPVGTDAAGRSTIGITPTENLAFKEAVETGATRNIGRETIKNALEPDKIAIQFKNDPDGVLKAFNQRLDDNLTKLTESNPEFKALAEQYGPDYLKKLKEIGVSTWRAGGDPKGMSGATRTVVNAVDSAWKKTTSGIQKSHAGKIDLAKQSQADYLQELERARLGETAPDILKDQGERSINARYLKFDPLTGKTQQVPQGTPGAMVFDDYAEGTRRFTPETVRGQQNALQEQVKTNTLGDNQFFRDLARPEFNKFVRDAAKNAGLPSDMARFSPAETKAWNSFKNISAPDTFTKTLFESPEALQSFVYHFGDDPKVMGMAKRQVAQQVVDGSMNFKGPKAESGGAVENTAFDRMVAMKPADFNKLMGNPDAHEILSKVAEASKLAQETMAKTGVKVQAKDIVMLTLAGMYSMGASAGSQPLAFGFAAATKALSNFHFGQTRIVENLLTAKGGTGKYFANMMKNYWENPAAFNGQKAQMFTKWADYIIRTKPSEADNEFEKVTAPPQ